MTRNACRSIISVIAVLMALTSGAFAQVVINEVHYRPAMAAVAQGEDPARLEFVELYNSGAAAVDLSGWSIKSAVEFTFPGGTLLAPDAYIVVARDPAFLKARFPSIPSGVQLLAWKSGDLSAGVVQLLDASQPLSMTLDQVAYSDNGLWPSEPSGTGPSLELLNAKLDNSNPRAWRASIGVNGTPGMRNSRASDGPIVIDETPQRGTSAVGLTQVSVTFSDAVRGVVASDLIVDGMPAKSVSGTGAGPYVFAVDAPKSEHIPVTLNNGAIASLAGPSFSGDSWYYFNPPATVMSMPAGAGGGPGSYANVPISAAPGSPGPGIYGIDMTISYDASKLEILATTDVTVSGVAALLSPPFALAVNISTPGTVVISEYAQGPALTSPGGEIANIRFHVKAGAVYGTTSYLTFASVSIDEGAVSAETHDGLFTVNCVGAGNGSACDDGTVCNGHETCVDNACTPGPALDCDDHNVCTTDSCDAVSGCQHGNEPSTLLCRASAGECDVAEYCDGAGACPADIFASAATTCTGTSQGGACDATDHCSGTANTCIDEYQASTVTCRASAGQCDVAEMCTGTSGACPADVFASTATTCTGASQGGACDATDHCSGTANTCIDEYEASTVTCRASAGECDVAEMCTGTSGACPADVFASTATTCTGTSQGGTCDATDHCSGTANTCIDEYQASTVTCRASAGECDVAEMCTGTSGACPADVFASTATTCTGASQGGACDATDHCSGTANTCIDEYQASTVTCRASAGECDVAEMCTGTSGACPADVFASTATTCTGTSQGGTCDATDHCSGTANTCIDEYQASTVTCRASAGECDVAEMCTGTSGACPADVFASTATTCTGASQGGACDATDHCSGTANTCIDEYEASTVTCRASAGQCDVAEMCTGTSGACPADAKRPNGSACTEDGNVCTTDLCNGISVTCIHDPGNAGTVCSPSNGPCDVAETCTGTSSACPAKTYDCSVGAHVYYYRDDTTNGGLGGEPSTKPVAGVPINLTGFASASTTSDPAGAYGFVNLFGNVAVTAGHLSGGVRATDLVDVIGSLDASRIAQSVVLLYPLTSKQFTAGDVTGDGTISAFDASYVARYAAQLVDHFPVGGGATDWTFVPLTYGYTPITASGGQDFLAILYGDVTGNWPGEGLMQSHAPGLKLPKSPEATAADAELANLLANRPAFQTTRSQNAGPAVLSMNERPGLLKAGERRQITIDLQNADGILGLDMSLGFDPSRIRIVDVQGTGLGTSFLWAKAGKDGTYKLAGYGIDPLSGSGPLLTVTVEALQNGGGPNLLRIQASANEGAIPLQTRGNGKEAQLSR